ncbi:MAG: LacI family DNA-binding transcriptional regulator [Candidatus Faecousia sp.]|nr:LacI family transcriptional regulator [Clostridiales bacterium]MDY6181250.1 LacI family DNA-binding transcriptional regulator [Candidatus Faecousia sp.]
MEKVTIRDIAEAAGVSTSTVSRIINGKGKYSQETKQTVWNAISSMGYSPNLIAQTLRSNTNPLVGIILPEGSSEYFSRLVNLLIHDMIRDGLIPMVCVTFHDENIEQAYCRTLSALNAGAIIYVFKETPVKKEAAHIPSIFVGTAPSDTEESTRVLFDVVGGAKRATDELIRAGCRRIAYFQSSRFRDGHVGRYLGYQQSLWENGLSVDEDLVLIAGGSEQRTVAEALDSLLQRGIRFDGIYSNTVTAAIEATNHLQKKGLRIPKDIKVISQGNGPLAEMYMPSISAIEMDSSLMCQSVISSLKQILTDGQLPRSTVRIPSVLYARQSTEG